MNREAVIVKTSIIGILTNILLVAFKIFVGFITSSIAVILDAVNNLSDALSSIVTIIGAKLAARRPDKDHPLGHGRYEYLSTLVVAALVLYAGITSLYESFKKIIEPVETNYTTVSLIIISATVIAKILLGLYVKKQGNKINSSSLVASGSDALFDAIISFSVLLSAFIAKFLGLSLEAYLGVIISIFIIKSSIEMFRDAIDDILGKRVDVEFAGDIKKTIAEEPLVQGAYDLILHNYGPDSFTGSVHISVPDTLNAEEIDLLERKIARNVYEKHGVALTGIGIYSINTRNKEASKMYENIRNIVSSFKGVIQTHAFYVDEENKIINLDIIIDFAVENREKLFNEIKEKVKETYPDYTLNFTLDLDI